MYFNNIDLITILISLKIELILYLTQFKMNLR